LFYQHRLSPEVQKFRFHVCQDLVHQLRSSSRIV
jgi:hypothetical protein